MNVYAMPASELEMCRCDDHAAHLRDSAKGFDRMAKGFRKAGNDHEFHRWKQAATTCRLLADELDAYKREQ